MERSGLELIRSLKRAHVVPRDSFSFCLKDRTSIRWLTTLEMGKKDKQKLEHRAFQSPCTLPTKVWAAVYLVPSDTKVLEIYLLKNMKILHDELLYDKA